jgi:mRNA-degrading endonuclease toxin of MazEF toxin-antitoxin module
MAKSRLVERWGTLDPAAMAEVEEALRIALALD